MLKFFMHKFRSDKFTINLILILSMYEWTDLLLAIWLFFFTQTLGLSALQAGVVYSIYGVFQFFFEIPTGIIADLKGRFFSYKIGSTISLISTTGFFITKRKP